MSTTTSKPTPATPRTKADMIAQYRTLARSLADEQGLSERDAEAIRKQMEQVRAEIEAMG